jgi:DNA mismatch repair ATPase MutS
MGASATIALRSFSRRFGFAELRQSTQIHPVVNLLTLWDVHWMFALEGWRRAYGSQVRKWFDALAELEALSSLAGFAHVRPDFCVPTVSEGRLALATQGLGHPLLEDPVPNGVSFADANAFVITGSNMSGKSTLLRALGINAVLALAGARVCATSLSISPLRVLTGMRVKDSLERGVSYFYAEVQRIKLLLDEAKAADGRALFLLDEILLGTNARERQVAAREILRLFLESGAIGMVATHDFTLSSMEGDRGLRVRNVHFEDQIVDGRMSFDYRLREGVVEQTNALRVLHAAGIDIRTPVDEGRAERG